MHPATGSDLRYERISVTTIARGVRPRNRISRSAAISPLFRHRSREHFRTLSLLVLVLFASLATVSETSATSSSADDPLSTRDFKIELRRGGGPDFTMKSGSHYMFPLAADVRDLGPGYEIHVAVFATHKGAILAELRPWDGPAEDLKVLPGRSHFSMGQLSMKGPARFSSKKDGKLIIAYLRIDMEQATATVLVREDKDSLPLIVVSGDKGSSRLVLPTDEIAKVFRQMFGLDQDTESEKEGEKEPLFSLLTILKLGSVSSAAEQMLKGRISLSPPKLPLAYDGIMLQPLVVQPKGDGKFMIHLDQVKAPAVVIPVTGAPGAEVFNLEQPKPKTAAKTSVPPPPLPELTIEVEPGAIPRGRQVRKRFRVRHGPAPLGAEIYIALLPGIHEKGVFFGRDGKGRTLRAEMKSYNMSLLACRSNLSASLMRIRQSPITIKPPIMFLPILEAGRLGAIEESNGGVVEGVIDFTAPPLAEWYDSLEATPMVFFWDESEGKLCAQIKMDPERGIPIPLVNP